MRALRTYLKGKLIEGQRGETLVETLFAILICTLATIVLLSATVTAVNLNKQANELDRVLQQEQQAAELSQGPTSAGTVTITGTGAGFGQDVSYGIKYYGGEHLQAYQYDDAQSNGS